MNSGVPVKPRVAVIGDVHLDVVLAPTPPDKQASRNWRNAYQYHEFRRAGGAWLLSEIIADATGGEAEVVTYPEPDGLTGTLVPGCPVSIALLRLYARGEDDKEKKVYRLRDHKVTGWIRHEGQKDAACDALHARTLRSLLGDVDRTPPPQVLVIHDHNNGFRSLSPEESLLPFTRGNPWFERKSEDEQPRGVIVWHADNPYGTGALWPYLCGEYKDHVVAVVNEDDLRQEGIDLKDYLSLEQTAAEFLDQLERSPLSDLARCSYLVVRFSNGVTVYRRGSEERSRTEHLTLALLPEGKRATRLRGEEHGLMIGYSLLMVGGITKGVVWSATSGADLPLADWSSLLDAGVQSGAELGVCYAQLHYRNGFLPEDFRDQKERPQPYARLLGMWPPAEDEVNRRELRIATVPFPPEIVRAGRKWSRLDTLPRDGGEIRDAAVEIAKCGYKEYVHSPGKGDGPRSPDWSPPWRMRAPYYELGDLQLIDGKEIDDFESITALVSQYLRTPAWKQPLSIAVFGPPGSGKSFAVKQVLRKVRARVPSADAKDADVLEFNLAQFRDSDELATAFHVVQDRALGGNVPLVFFDEFDSGVGRHDLFWLKYFLSPMQDGKFRHGNTTYRVGRAIFVFAGGTHATFSDFEKGGEARAGAGVATEAGPGGDVGKQAAGAHHTPRNGGEVFKNAKGPDFVSRLRGHLNIAGINGDGGEITDSLLVRRAILLNSFLKIHCSRIIRDGVADIDRGVVKAFLLTPNYRHGVRSMEAIVQMAGIAARGTFQKSSVPHRNQLKMHVDPDEFMERVRGG